MTNVGLIYLAKGKPIAVSGIDGFAFQAVYYPYRKTPDLYVTMKDMPGFCAQCGESFPIESLILHIVSHDRRKAPFQRAEGFNPDIVPKPVELLPLQGGQPVVD